jgi:hypothetical protein
MTLTPAQAVATALFFVLLAPAHALQAGKDPDPEALRAQRSFDRLVKTEETVLAVEMWDLAQWCRGHRLYLECDRLAHAILEIDFDHAGARKTLKYHRRGDDWAQSKSYRPPRSHARDVHEEEYPELLAALLDPYKARLFRRLERDARLLSPGTREQTLRKLLLLEPDDVALRTVLGESKWDGRWVLAETATTAEGGRAISTYADEALAEVRRPELDAATKAERGLGLRWNATMKTPGVRVLGTTPRKEVDETARVAEATQGLFQRVFKHGQGHRSGYTIFLLEGPGEREALISGIPGVPQATQDLLRQAGGGWLSSNKLAEWDGNPARRLDGAARQTIGTLLMDSYGIDGRHGWAWEGIGLYLVYHMTGTRLTYFFKGSGYSSGRKTTLWPMLQAPDARWLHEARDLLAKDSAPGLEFLLGRDVNTMRDEDILVSYTLAAYLLEGRPDDVPRILRRIGAGEHPVTVFEQVTGDSLPQLEQRLRRWLDEVLVR